MLFLQKKSTYLTFLYLSVERIYITFFMDAIRNKNEKIAF